MRIWIARHGVCRGKQTYVRSEILLTQGEIALTRSEILLAQCEIRPAAGERNFHQTRSPRGYCWVYVRQHCAEIDEAARNRMELIVPELVKRNGVTEQLKAENQMEWVRQMNACKAQAEEVVKAELIYD